MSRPIGELKNFGPYMVRIMNEIGIYTESDLLDTEYHSIQEKLIARKIEANLLIFYSIEMGLQNRTWNEISPTEKSEIKELLKRTFTDNL